MGIGWLGADKRVCGLSGDVAFTGRSAVSELWQIEPRYMLTGGVIGAFITYTVIKSFDALGKPAKSALLIVVAQILVAYLIEVFGWFGGESGI